MGERSLRDDGHGLSDVLGYVLVFSLVVTSVLVVTVGGLSAVENARDAERAQNAERAFDVVATNFAAIYERDAPSRSTELDLADSEIFYNSNSSITVRGGGQELVSRNVRPVEMNVVGDRSVVYEAGAVFRENGDDVSMVRPPPFLLTGGQVHLPVVQTTTPTIESAGSTTALLRGVSTNRSVVTAANGDTPGFNQLTVEITSPRFGAWERYFTEEGLDCTTFPATETVSCTLDLDSTFSVYVTLQRIEMSLIL